MSGLESDTIGGFNSMIEKQQKVEGEVLVSTILFDDRCEVLHDRVRISEVPKMTEDDYSVRGCTALLDAVGGAIHHIGNVHKYVREEDCPAKTLFVITTDGLENASKEYRYEDVKKLVEKQKEKYNWEFLFLGANIDAIEVASHMGISRERATNFNCDSKGIALTFDSLSVAIPQFTRCKSSEVDALMTCESWKKRISEDYEQRSASH